MSISYALVGIITVYAVALFLLHFTKYANEPPTVDSEMPFLNPIAGLIRKKWHYYVELRDNYCCPILTLRLPGIRLYIVNSIPLIQVVQKQSRALAMPPLEAKAMIRVLNLSKQSHAILKENIDGRQGDWGFMFMFYKTIHPPMAAAGVGLDAMNRTSIQRVGELLDKLSEGGPSTLAFFSLVKQQIMIATSDAVYGPNNPFRDPVIQDAYWKFEPGIIKLLLGLGMFAKTTLVARDKIANVFEEYFLTGAHRQGSALIQAHYDHAITYKIPLVDLAQLEVAASLGVLSNIIPTTFWLLFHLYSDLDALRVCRNEIANVTKDTVDEYGNCTRIIDVSEVRSSCPTLLSSFQETLRLHTVGASARMVMEDMTLDGKFFLKEGSIVLLPQSVQHTDQSVWGTNTEVFDCTRFTSKKTRMHSIAFRGFGGGTTLCPGRHFATTEVLAYTAMFIMRFDVQPSDGEWVQPSTNNSGIWTVTEGPDHDFDVFCRIREGVNPDLRWCLSLSKSNHVMKLAAEDYTIS